MNRAPSSPPRGRRAHGVDGMHRHAKERRTVGFLEGYRDRLLPRTQRCQQALAPLHQQGPQQKHPLMGHDHQEAGLGFHRAIDHQQIAVEDTAATHAVAGDPHVEGADRPGHQQGIEIKQLPPGRIAEGERLIEGQVEEHRAPAQRTDVLVCAGRPGRRRGCSRRPGCHHHPVDRCPARPGCRRDHRHHRHRDALVLEHLAVADGIAAGFHRRYRDLLELDDLRQEARLELVRAAARCQGGRPVPYLRRCIRGALQHHLRDRALLVRLPAKRRDATPWRHVSLDVPAPGEEQSRLEQLVAPCSSLPQEPAPESQDQLPEGLAARLMALPAQQAAAVRLTLLQGLSLREAAVQLGVSRSTVHRAQRQGLVALREQLVGRAGHGLIAGKCGIRRA
jgi:RNA polymerase sigma factor (sigma-70 family)